MICNKCNNEGIENQANGSKFWYCRTCKNEIVNDLHIGYAKAIEIPLLYGSGTMKIEPTPLDQDPEVQREYEKYLDELSALDNNKPIVKDDQVVSVKTELTAYDFAILFLCKTFQLGLGTSAKDFFKRQQSLIPETYLDTPPEDEL